MTKTDLYEKACKQYIFFLKYTNPNSSKFHIWPPNLLELLNNSYRRKMNLKSQL